MNFKGIVIVLAFGAAIAQENPFPDIKEKMFHLHDQFEGYQDTMRLTMGVLGSDLSTWVVGVLTNSIASWQNRLLFMCPSVLNTEATGEILRGCSYEAAMEMFQLQTTAFDAIEAMHGTSNDVSLRIVEELVTFNIVRRHEEFVEHFEPIIASYEAQLDTYAADIAYKVVQFIELGDTLPQRTEECIEQGFRNILKTCM